MLGVCGVIFSQCKCSVLKGLFVCLCNESICGKLPNFCYTLLRFEQVCTIALLDRLLSKQLIRYVDLYGDDIG